MTINYISRNNRSIENYSYYRLTFRYQLENIIILLSVRTLHLYFRQDISTSTYKIDVIILKKNKH